MGANSSDMSYHMVCYINRQMFPSIMDSNIMADHCGYNGGCRDQVILISFSAFVLSLLIFHDK